MKWNAVLLLACASCFAQVDTGSIAGTVKDASGAVVAGAAVDIVDDATRLRVVRRTNGLGQYLSPPLRPGPYHVSVEQSGFVRETSAIELTLNQRAVVSTGLPDSFLAARREPGIHRSQSAHPLCGTMEPRTGSAAAICRVRIGRLPAGSILPRLSRRRPISSATPAAIS